MAATVGIVCEYNPFHNGHAAQLRAIRARFEPEARIVCAMSGNYVQRGAPACFDKTVRAEAAVRGGADLVVELPLPFAIASAEQFAAAGVRLLDALGCDTISFGCERADPAELRRLAELNLQPAFDEAVREALSRGVSYAAARQTALEALGAPEAPALPNDILAVEYWKALLRQGSRMEVFAVRRPGSYHAETLDPAAPSASALRAVLDEPAAWKRAVPENLHALYETAPRYDFAAGERAVLARLRTLPDAAFAALPYGSEGLWRKLAAACRSAASVEEILTQTKSKRYARSRIQRMLLWAYLGLSADLLDRDPAWVRVLGFNDRGRGLLHAYAGPLTPVNAGAVPPDPGAWETECRAGDLFTLFAVGPETPCGLEAGARVRYLP